MAQRWMQAKMILAKRNGTVRSGCNRANGECWDDVMVSRGTKDRDGTWFMPVSKNNGAARVKRRPIERKSNRAARRAHLQT